MLIGLYTYLSPERPEKPEKPEKYLYTPNGTHTALKTTPSIHELSAQGQFLESQILVPMVVSTDEEKQRFSQPRHPFLGHRRLIIAVIVICY